MNDAAEQLSGEAWIGRVIGDRYRILAHLGEGGMGAVYVAEQLALHKEVALKIVHPSFAGDGEIRARFAREAMASAQLDEHPNVASALDFGTLPDGSLYLVMQLVRGPNLQTCIEHGPIPWPKACALGSQIADALAAAHARQIVHRDLKPENVMLVSREDGGELVKVLDFGIARIPSEEARGPAAAAPGQKLTRVGAIMGTPGYMSPEQATGGAVDHRTDLYALGVILWEMLTGRPLFEGTEFPQIVTQQLTTTPARLRDIVPDPTLPDVLDELVASLLHTAPDQRPDKASAIRDTLSELAMRASFEADGALPSGSLQFDRITGSITRSRIDARAATTLSNPGPLPAIAVARRTLHTARQRFDALPEERRKHVLIGAAVGLALLVLAPFVLGSDEEDVAPPDVAEVAAAPEAPEPTASRRRRAPPAREQPRVEAPTVAPAVGVDGAIAILFSTEEDRSARDAAARAILDLGERSPAYASAVARLELARGCRPRKDELAAIRELGDARALPYIQRLDGLPRRGCGFLGSKDCHGCIRGDITATRTALQSRAD